MTILISCSYSGLNTMQTLGGSKATKYNCDLRNVRMLKMTLTDIYLGRLLPSLFESLRLQLRLGYVIMRLGSNG